MTGVATGASAEAQVPPTVDLLGFPFHRVSESECVEHVLAALQAGRGGWVVTPNLDILRQVARSQALWAFFRSADLIVADGMPIVWASRLIGDPLPERVAGSSLITTLSGGAARDGRSIYLLGGDPGTAEDAASALCRRYPDLRVSGCACPPHGFDRDPERIERIAAEVAQAGPDIVYVALGCPKQEYLIARLRMALPTAWYLGVGISFSYLSGRVRRAPRWMRRSGLEWGYRLMQEPGRLVRRYLRDDLPFALELTALAARARLGRRGRPRLAPESWDGCRASPRDGATAR